jgi:hypothetical protein
LQYWRFSFVISIMNLRLIPLFLAAITTFLTDSKDEIFNGKLELPQTSIL